MESRGSMKCQYLLLGLLCLLCHPVVAQPTINLSVISPLVVPIITNSTIEPGFATITAAVTAPIFTPDDLQVTLEWSSNTAVNYIITAFVDNDAIDAEGIPLPSIPVSGTLGTVPQEFNINFNCSDIGLFTTIYVLSFYEVDTDAPLSKHVIYFTKDCRVPGCSEVCEEHGSCNYNYGECVCNEGYFGTDCNIIFQFDLPNPYCIQDTPTISWAIPEDLATPKYDFKIQPRTELIPIHSDWISIIGSNTLAMDLSEVQWFYLNTLKRLSAFSASPVGNYTMRFSAPGEYKILLLSNDGYYSLAEQTFVVSNLTAECTGGFDCRASGCQAGTCDETSGQCECEPGHFWYDCSLGCSGTERVTANSSRITDGSDNRPSAGFNVSCGWLIEPPEPFDNITVVFEVFEVSESAPLMIFEGNSSTMLLSVSGQDVPKSFVSTQRTLLVYIDSRSLGYSGFAVNYFTSYTPFAKRSQQSIDWDSAPGLAMTVITGALILLVTASFITIFVKREHFVVKASSFVWTGMIMGGIVLGYFTVFTFIGRVTSWQCVLRIWFAEFGFIFVFGCLFLKNWRIYLIFTNKKLRVRIVKDSYLFKILSILLAFEAALCALWTALDFPDVGLSTDDLDPNVAYYACKWTNEVFPIISIFAKVILVAWGVFISYKSRTALTYYSEAKYAGVAIYNFSFCLIIFIPLLYILARFYLIWWILSCTAIIAVCAGSTAAMLWRLFFFIVRFPNNKPPSEYKTSTINMSPASARSAAGFSPGSLYSSGTGSGTGSATDNDTNDTDNQVKIANNITGN